MNRNKLTSAALCAVLLLCLAACSRPEPQPVSSDMTSGTAAAEISSECLISSASSETNSAFLSEPVQTAENNSTVSAGSSSKANVSAASSTSASPSKPKPPTVSSTPPKPPVPVSSVPPAAESSSPQEPDEPEPELPEEKDPYAYPFDIEAIRQDLIEYGESLEMKHRTHYSDGTEVTPDNGSWELPLYIKKGFPSNIMQRRLHEQLDSYHNIYKAEAFTIYIESYGNSEYQIYSIYA